MYRIKAVLVFLLLATFAHGAYSADGNSHYSAAERFYGMTSQDDMEAVIQQISADIVSDNQMMAAYVFILEGFMKDIVDSEEYKGEIIRNYLSFMSEQELNELTEIFKNPVYRKFRQVQKEMLIINEVTIRNILQEREAEIIAQIYEYDSSMAPADTSAYR